MTGSFDKTAKVWNGTTGACVQTFYGHSAEVVGVEFNSPNTTLLATASMDHTSRVFHVETGNYYLCIFYNLTLKPGLI